MQNTYGTMGFSLGICAIFVGVVGAFLAPDKVTSVIGFIQAIPAFIVRLVS